MGFMPKVFEVGRTEEHRPYAFVHQAKKTFKSSRQPFLPNHPACTYEGISGVGTE